MVRTQLANQLTLNSRVCVCGVILNEADINTHESILHVHIRKANPLKYSLPAWMDFKKKCKSICRTSDIFNLGKSSFAMLQLEVLIKPKDRNLMSFSSESLIDLGCVFTNVTHLSSEIFIQHVMQSLKFYSTLKYSWININTKFYILYRPFAK